MSAYAARIRRVRQRLAVTYALTFISLGLLAFAVVRSVRLDGVDALVWLTGVPSVVALLAAWRINEGTLAECRGLLRDLEADR